MLISLMGGLNHPDLATRAGEEPLPQSDDSDLDEPMDVDGDDSPNEKKINLVHLAENALPLVESHDERSGDQHGSLKNENTRPERPKILTRASPSDSKDIKDYPNDRLRVKAQTLSCQSHSDRRNSSPATAAERKAHGNGSKLSASPSRSKSPKNDDSDSVAISPMLRRFTIPNSERSPTETLPAMQHSPQSSSSKSPNGQQSLPSLRAIQLEPLLDSRSPNENSPHPMNRSPFPINNGSVNSPSMSSIAPRPSQYPSPQTRINGNFAHAYPHGQLSPAYSDASPREHAAMSPPGKPSPHHYYPQGRTPQSEELTPQSAESHLSSSSFSTVSSPRTDHVEIDRGRPILPPLAGLPGGPLITGAFKCEHAGCTAPPFQTQYLLK